MIIEPRRRRDANKIRFLSVSASLRFTFFEPRLSQRRKNFKCDSPENGAIASSGLKPSPSWERVGWGARGAFRRSPNARKLWYNLTITAASVFVAIFIGGVEALGLIGNQLGSMPAFGALPAT